MCLGLNNNNDDDDNNNNDNNNNEMNFCRDNLPRAPIRVRRPSVTSMAAEPLIQGVADHLNM